MQQIFDFPLTPSYTFDNFAPCPANAAALRFAGMMSDPAGSEAILYIYGPRGSGKTHLLGAIAHASGTMPSSIVSPGEFEGTSPSRDIACALAGLPVLLMDDVHLLRRGTPQHDMVWHLCNEFHSTGKKIVATGLVPPKELDLDEHLQSRLLWGLVARIDMPDDDSRLMILRKLAADRQISVPEDSFSYLLSRADRDVGSLVALFGDVYRRSLFLKRPITPSLIRDTLVAERTLLSGTERQ